MAAVDWFADRSVYVVDLALACCALESQAALAARPRVELTQIPDGARVVCTVSGTVTGAMAPATRSAIEALPEGATVVAFGACACAGGPYWDSYAVRKGVGELVEVDHFVAGCPPPPGAFAQILEEVRRG
ncbi:NADH-quinone oxidoreductase subunit B [Tessaracoccus sp. OH4464_COT-324]|uniref:NADH-quinone oxidoreductase subunit B n=1 Tax=Tessaracoccus sp. OH4464_COT-324 TaxID=2491059 RepID=UPI000F640855|nr:proton-conducting membrane transporter [Tessaracoccus sp. OH4464_COT-324]